MAISVKANITNGILRWARETAGRTVEEAAKRANVDGERYAAWENGDDTPTVNQLRTLASFLKRPLAAFYLPEPPLSPDPLPDFRRMAGIAPNPLSPNLIGQIREAAYRRENALSILSEIDETPPEFTLFAYRQSSAESVASVARQALGITPDAQAKWRDPRVAFNAWRGRVENLGVLVFQASGVDPSESRGFSISEKVLPVVAVNSADSHAGRTFTLFHELAHLILRRSGICDLDDTEDSRPPEAKRFEVFCNAVAAEVTMPRASFLQQDIVASRTETHHEWSDDDIRELSRRYSVSREAIVRRLLELGRTAVEFYGRKREQYLAEQLARAAQKEKSKRQGGPSPHRKAVSNLGKPYVRLVLTGYHQEYLTLSDVSNFLGIKIKHLRKIEDAVSGP